nr:hypothetical protein [Tanacetum cinerariifolium]
EVVLYALYLRCATTSRLRTRIPSRPRMEVSPRLFCSVLKVYHLPPASSIREDAYSTKAYSDLPCNTECREDHCRSHMSPSRWKELSKETSSKILSFGDGSYWKTFKPIASLIAKGKLKKTQARSFAIFTVKVKIFWIQVESVRVDAVKKCCEAVTR